MLHDRSKYDIPLKDQAHILYNLAQKEIYDPSVFEKFEKVLKLSSSTHMNARLCYGALWAYYKTNQGTRFGVDFWEAKLEDNIEGLHAQEVHGLLVAFKDNR
jgi:hypothetical protein